MTTNKHLMPILMMGICAIIAGASCKKSSSSPKSKSEYLTQATWKFVKSEYRVGTTGAWTDDTNTYGACEKDNLYIFRTNATYEANEGATKCFAADPQIIESGTWSFGANETQVLTRPTGSSSADIVNIEQLDDNTFISTASSGGGGITYYYRLTFGH
jgi:hypothetical protein